MADIFDSRFSTRMDSATMSDVERLYRYECERIGTVSKSAIMREIVRRGVLQMMMARGLRREGE